MAWCGMVWLVWDDFGMLRHRVVWYGVVKRDVVWCGLPWFGIILWYMALHGGTGNAQCGMDRCSTF